MHRHRPALQAKHDGDLLHVAQVDDLVDEGVQATCNQQQSPAAAVRTWKQAVDMRWDGGG